MKGKRLLTAMLAVVTALCMMLAPAIDVSADAAKAGQPASQGETAYDIDVIDWYELDEEHNITFYIPIGAFGDNDEYEPDGCEIENADVLQSVKSAAGSDDITEDDVRAYSFNFYKESGKSNMQPEHPLLIEFTNLPKSFFDTSAGSLHAYSVSSGSAHEIKIHETNKLGRSVKVEASSFGTLALAFVPKSTGAGGSGDGPVHFSKIWSPLTKREPVRVRVTIPTQVSVRTGVVRKAAPSGRSAGNSNADVSVSNVTRVSENTYKCDTTFTVDFDGSQDAGVRKALAAKGELTSDEKPVSDDTVTWNESVSDSQLSYSILAGLQKKSGIRYVSGGRMLASPEADFDYKNMIVTETKPDGTPLTDSKLQEVSYDSSAERIELNNSGRADINVKVKWIGYGYKEKNNIGNLPVDAAEFSIVDKRKNEPVYVRTSSAEKDEGQEYFCVDRNEDGSHERWRERVAILKYDNNEGYTFSSDKDYTLREYVEDPDSPDSLDPYEAKIIPKTSTKTDSGQPAINAFCVFNARLGKAKVTAKYVGFEGSYPTGIGASMTETGGSGTKSFTLPDDDGGSTMVSGLSLYHLDELDNTDFLDFIMSDANRQVIDFPDSAEDVTYDGNPDHDNYYNIMKRVCTLKQYGLNVDSSPYYTAIVRKTAAAGAVSKSAGIEPTKAGQNVNNAAAAPAFDSGMMKFAAPAGGSGEEEPPLGPGPDIYGIDYNYEVTVMPVYRDIKVTKKWGEDTKAHPVTVRLMRDGVFTGQTLILNEENGYTASFSRLQKYDYSGGYREYNYTVEETGAGSDYWKTATEGSMDDGYVITNDAPRRSISVTKKWGRGTKPQEITVHLLRDGRDTGKTVTLNGANSYTASFDDLPKYNYEKPVGEDSYEEYKYTVKEENDDKWKAKVTGSMEDGFTITNNKKKTGKTDNTGKTDDSDNNDDKKGPKKTDNRSKWQGGKNADRRNGTGSGKEGSSSPRTGDSGSIALWVIVLIGAASAAGAFYSGRKKHNA
ncbi:MAG: Cna B-type domain-containing protein [Anaerovoracaceae bacterium]